VPGAPRDGAPDDAALVEATGTAVAVVPGDPTNWKLTDPSDVIVLSSRLAARGGR
jgi:2-C-methyl-D-erythritol 4-phosphate cytidylyltransferase/2-C-methyl-D-erythritol 4-phosphate cytidylyltransferase/2-C-methyl-D-erythritol 2,4-cyclodiphosphate synthase